MSAEVGFIPCSFCDCPATRVCTHDDRETRRFACDEHAEDARAAKKPLEGRNLYLYLGLSEVASELRKRNRLHER